MTRVIQTSTNILLSTTSDVLEYKVTVNVNLSIVKFVNVNVNSSIYRLLKIIPCYAQGNCISSMEFTPGLLESVRHPMQTLKELCVLNTRLDKS